MTTIMKYITINGICNCGQEMTNGEKSFFAWITNHAIQHVLNGYKCNLIVETKLWHSEVGSNHIDNF